VLAYFFFFGFFFDFPASLSAMATDCFWLNFPVLLSSEMFLLIVF
jgi:hypothetical protein